MIRVLVPRPVADALMPRACARCAGVGHLGPATDSPVFLYGARCPTCDGSGSLPPVLTWLVVEGDRCKANQDGDCSWEHCPQLRDGEPVRSGRHCPIDTWAYEAEDENGPAAPPADLVRAIESGERIGIDEACDCDEGRVWTYRNSGPFYAVPCTDCTDGRVLVGSVRPTEVLPVVDGDVACESYPDDGIYVSARLGTAWRDSDCMTDIDLSLYGDPGSLVGRYAIAVTDARREE